MASTLSDGSLVTHQIWTQSGQPLWSYRGRGCLRHPLPGTCHVPWQAPVDIGTGQIRNLLNGDIEERRPFVNRSTRYRYKLLKSVMGSGRVGSGRVGLGRACWDFSLKPQKNSLRALRSARKKKNTNIRGVAHVLWAILHVEYSGDGLRAFWVHLGEPSYKVRSRSCQKFQISKCLILENKGLFMMQNVPRNPMVPFVFSVRGL